ncbi:hypothetical protein HDV03_001018 [Kappamyces sp. JEL0829]|nr:hypothetical protein HDV03_001018 [Kappamyces sp. JEL0829]
MSACGQTLTNNMRLLTFHLKSLLMLITTPSLWFLILGPLVLVAMLGVLATVLLFVLALAPQARALISLYPSSSSWSVWAWVLAVILCLVEAFLFLLFLSLFLQRSQDRAFDIILKKKCPYLYGTALSHGRPSVDADGMQLRLQSILASAKSLGLFAVLAPINIIPVVGTAAYVSIEGYYQGPLSHERYFALKKFTREEKMAFIKRHRRVYWAFGVEKTIIDMIPLVNILGLYVNALAGAFLAVHLEEYDRAAQLATEDVTTTMTS